MAQLITSTDRGLYCAAGDFYIDPWKPVDRALITHAHSDHARPGSKLYLTCQAGERILRERLPDAHAIQTVVYGQRVSRNGVSISFHPAGHILGSAQIRVEYRGEVWVVTGDYKTERDTTCTPFEPVTCNTLITESTFALPIYRWKPQDIVFEEVNAWWRHNRERGVNSIVFAYALGKAQRVLSGLDPSIGPIVGHGSVANLLPIYQEAGIHLPHVERAVSEQLKSWKGTMMVVAPPNAFRTPWMRKFEPYATAFASGWMQLRGARRRQNVDRGFVLSDHADWDGLIDTVKATGATCIMPTHGYTTTFVRWLQEQGYDAKRIPTHFDDPEEPEPAETQSDDGEE